MQGTEAEEPNTDDGFRGLATWWNKFGKGFSLWFLSLPTNSQVALLKIVVPDIPETISSSSTNTTVFDCASSSSSSSGAVASPLTHLIVPDMTTNGLTAGQGRCMVLFLNRILGNPFATALNDDIKRMKQLKAQNKLPKTLFTNKEDFEKYYGPESQVHYPHIDITDPAESVRCISDPVALSQERVTELQRLFDINRLVDVHVWIAVKLRRMIIVKFIFGLVEAFEAGNKLTDAQAPKSGSNDMTESSTYIQARKYVIAEMQQRLSDNNSANDNK